MKKLISLVAILHLTIFSFGQTENAKLIELSKTYNQFMFRNEPTKDVLKNLSTNVSNDLLTTVNFIQQTITSKNKLLTQQYLSRPNDKVLKQIYIVRALDLNQHEENPIDANKLIDSLNSTVIPVYELVDNYYGMMFTAVGNKNQPFNLSKIDFKLNDYNLKDDTERGILFMRCMKYCNTVIWGFMNIPNPPNTKKAYEHIKKYPKFNGSPYYQYNDFNFGDFEMIIITDKGNQSYKSHYLDKYFETLLFHLVTLSNENAPEKERYDLILGSILKDKKLYQYTQYKDVLEDIFKEQ